MWQGIPAAMLIVSFTFPNGLFDTPGNSSPFLNGATTNNDIPTDPSPINRFGVRQFTIEFDSHVRSGDQIRLVNDAGRLRCGRRRLRRVAGRF
jgi:hypothetical protein